MSSRPLAVITGASSGIGAAFAEVFAANGHDLVLCARRQSRLDELATRLTAQSKVSVDTVSIDLAKRKGPAKLFAFLNQIDRPVDVLINNAGTANTGAFADTSERQAHDLLALNIRATTETCRQALPGMIKRGRGRILNVSSVVGFQAVPGMSLYAASKAFVLSFTEGLNEELRGTGVAACALCPGLTQTEMAKDLGTDRIPGSQLLMADAASVAQAGYHALQRGASVHVPGCLNQAAVTWSELQPRWVRRMIAGIAGRVVLTQTH